MQTIYLASKHSEDGTFELKKAVDSACVLVLTNLVKYNCLLRVVMLI